MLIGINPLLNADILYALASMGHGEELVICDRNFPAASTATQTTLQMPIQLSGDVLPTLKAILTVFPIDTFDLEKPPVRGMQIVNSPGDVPEIVAAAGPIFNKMSTKVALLERYAFYEAASKAFVIIQTTETLPYGNFILRKGVV